MKSLFEMTPDERAQLKRDNPPIIDGANFRSIDLSWGWKGCGFGQLWVELGKPEFTLDKKHSITVGNECISREDVRAILHAFADYIAERAILDDNPEDIPPVDYHAERSAINAEDDALIMIQPNENP